MAFERRAAALATSLLCGFLASAPATAREPVEPARAPAVRPADFALTLELQAARKFTANDIKSFVYRVFSMYERATSGTKRVPVEAFRPLLDEHVSIDFPDYKITGWNDFVEWHRWIHDQLVGDDHRIGTIDVEFLTDGRYRARFVVNWRAMFKDGRYTDVRVEQVWTLREQADRDLPVIETYVAHLVGPAEAS